MRISIEVDDELLAEAILLTGVESEREVVELGLKTMVTLNRQKSIQEYWGKLKWEGDLEEMRRTRG